VSAQLLPHVLAHGIGGVQDLPVPKWLFFWGGAFVLVVSFILLGALWKTPQLDRHAGGRDLGQAFGKIVLGPVRIVVQALSAFLFVVILAAALFGNTDPFGNIAPTWVYVIFWVGMPLLSLLFGNVWRALSPWRAIADGFVWVWEHPLGRQAQPAGHVPPETRPLPGLRHVLRLRRARAGLLQPRESAGARVRDRPVLVRGAVRDARLRARHLDGRG
jgi:hypothetical protein